MNAAVAVASGVFLTAALAPSVAVADAAGPTDFETVIVGVEPEADGVEMSVEGGDAFLRVTVEPGREVVVVGYHGEPYLRIDRTGVVERNRLSYATYYNEDRYGLSAVPEFVDNSAEPEWIRVGDGGAWSWHDHRAHWMGTDPPIGLEPGESLPDQTVPLVVDGADVTVTVRTTLLSGPPVWPMIVGAFVGILVAAGGVRAGPASTLLVMFLFGVAATVVGTAQFRSLSSQTGPASTWWLLPAMSVTATGVAVAVYGRWRLLTPALSALAACQVLLWAVRRRDGLAAAFVPTDLPGGADRFVTAAVLVGCSIVGVVSLVRLFGSVTPSGQGRLVGSE